MQIRVQTVSVANCQALQVRRLRASPNPTGSTLQGHAPEISEAGGSGRFLHARMLDHAEGNPTSAPTSSHDNFQNFGKIINSCIIRMLEHSNTMACTVMCRRRVVGGQAESTSLPRVTLRMKEAVWSKCQTCFGRAQRGRCICAAQIPTDRHFAWHRRCQANSRRRPRLHKPNTSPCSPRYRGVGRGAQIQNQPSGLAECISAPSGLRTAEQTLDSTGIRCFYVLECDACGLAWLNVDRPDGPHGEQLLFIPTCGRQPIHDIAHAADR